MPANKKTKFCQSSMHFGAKLVKFVLGAEVISYLDFLFLHIQPVKYIDFKPFPEIETIHFQARRSLQPLLKERPKGFMLFISCSEQVQPHSYVN